jgi:hypothetical protein
MKSNWKNVICSIFMLFVVYQLIEIKNVLDDIEWDTSSISSITSDVYSIKSDVSLIQVKIDY